METETEDLFENFISRLKCHAQKYPNLIKTTLANIFTMRLIGNKTHGDLAEIAIPVFINQYMYDFHSDHVGKKRYRSKTQEEDLEIRDKINEKKFVVSLKAYGLGPIQLSTDKTGKMFSRLEEEEKEVVGKQAVGKILNDPAFNGLKNINVLCLIYDEKKRPKKCNILTFDFEQFKQNASKIIRIDPGDEESGNRKHPVYCFFDKDDDYICEVRYGQANANALQRGLWSNTRKGIHYFDSVTEGWITYKYNHKLVELISHALNSTKASHKSAIKIIVKDIEKRSSELKNQTIRSN